MVVNLTQHNPTPQMREAGVTDIIPSAIDLLNFYNPPTYEEMVERAITLSNIVKRECPDATTVMLGGAPFFMGILESVLHSDGYDIVYAFSRRIVLEERQEDGTVKKTSTFVFDGFVRPFECLD